MTWSKLRSALNSPRAHVAAIVASFAAVGGAVAGGVAALINAMVRTPNEPVSAAQIAMMALAYGLIAGVPASVFGTLIAFGALRRVPLGRIILGTNVGLAAGLTTGWLAGPWAWHHMELLGALGFCAGALLVLVASRRSVPGPQLAAVVIPDYGSVASPSPNEGPSLASPVDLAVPARHDAIPVPRGARSG